MTKKKLDDRHFTKYSNFRPAQYFGGPFVNKTEISDFPDLRSRTKNFSLVMFKKNIISGLQVVVRMNKGNAVDYLLEDILNLSRCRPRWNIIHEVWCFHFNGPCPLAIDRTFEVEVTCLIRGLRHAHLGCSPRLINGNDSRPSPYHRYIKRFAQLTRGIPPQNSGKCIQ